MYIYTWCMHNVYVYTKELVLLSFIVYEEVQNL